MIFQISPLPKSKFEHLLTLSDAELAIHGAVRQIVTRKPGFPCRVSLEDAEIGESVILAHYEHHAAATPFRASHAVYIRPSAAEAKPAIGVVPELLRTRILSLRAFDATGMMIDADLADGRDLEPAITRLLEDTNAAYLHIHYAKPGCYAARVDRVLHAEI